MKIGSLFFLVLVSLLIAVPCSGQGYLVHLYSEADGLPSSTVHGITQDHWGRIWLATRAGLAVYDGVSWETFTVADGLPVLSYFKITVDRKGRIWALSDSRYGKIHVVYHDPEESPDRETRTRENSGSAWHQLETAVINFRQPIEMTALQLLETPPGDFPIIAVGTANHGLLLWNRGKWRQITPTDGLASSTISGLAALSGKLYAATAGGISIIQVKDNNILIDNHWNQSLGLPGRELKGIAVEDKNRYPDYSLQHSRIWLCGPRWLGYTEEQDQAGQRPLKVYPIDMSTGEENGAVTLSPDYWGGVYLGKRYELIYFNYKNQSWEYLGVKNNLIGGGGNSIFSDYEKNTWIACDRGISKISSRRFCNLQMTNGLWEDEVTAVVEYEPGKAVLGHNTGITVYNGKEFTKISLIETKPPHFPLSGIRVLDMKTDSRKNVWIAANQAGLAKVDPRAPHRYQWYGKEQGLSGDIICLWIDTEKTDQIWVGTGEGIFCGSEKEFELIRFNNASIANARRLYGSAGKLRLIATHLSGIYCYVEEDDRWENYQVASDPNANNVFSIKADSRGRIFVGTLSGLFILENKELKKFTVADFRIDRPVYFILEDLKHRLWFGTDNGVVRWDGSKARRYSIREGLIGQETNRAAGMTDSSGRVWIGTNRGVSIYNEDYDNNDRFRPAARVQLLYLEVPGKTIPLNKPVQLDYHENTIFFHFRGISFTDEAAILFSSRLGGFETEWSEEHYPYNQAIRYTNLPPGRYRFYLKARNALGVWSSVVASPVITISQPFHKRWWFYLLMALLVGVVSFGISRFFYERHQAALLEKQVKERTQQLLAVEQRYRRLFEESQDMVFIVTPAGKLVEVNPAGVELLGCQSREEMLGVPSIIHFYLHPADRTTFRREIEKQGYVKDYELTYKRRDGELVTVLETATVERDETGKIVAYRGIARDITEQKRLEEQLIQAQKMEAIGKLAGGIAHDFNNILAVIMGLAELMRDELPEGVEEFDNARINWLRKSTNSIVNAADRGAELVKQILTFSRQSKQERKPTDLCRIIKDSLSLLRSILPATIEIRQEIPPGPKVVLADVTQLRQVMMNFGTNAAHAMRESGGVLEVRLDEIDLDEETAKNYNDINSGPYLRLTVNDTGHGMAPELMKRIFEPYFTTKKLGEGTGMGLAVIHGIVKSHGGDISVRSELGKGTTFQVFLPYLGERKMAPQKQAADKIPGGCEQILLVDDETRLVEAVGGILKKMGYRVKEISNPLDALALFREQPGQFDLVISDVTMPHLTGLQLAREIRGINPDIPIILCSGFGSAVTREQIKTLGISHFITKPINRSNLARVIRKVLDSKPENHPYPPSNFVNREDTRRNAKK
jgi:PAS domain S-box-containing protein